MQRLTTIAAALCLRPAWPAIGLAGSLALPGTVVAQANDSTRVRAVALGLIAADNSRAIERVLGCYAPDAVLLPPNDAPVAGRARIRPRYEVLFRDFDPMIESTIHELVVAGDLAYVRGHNGGRFKARRSNVADRALNDDFLMILRRSSAGTWLITRLMWHASGR
jgi:ketosteroid isomerase-like protein